ncbi:hypothetical protein BgiMline_016016, partial [Biomphalaria glabrata]
FCQCPNDEVSTFPVTDCLTCSVTEAHTYNPRLEAWSYEVNRVMEKTCSCLGNVKNTYTQNVEPS